MSAKADSANDEGLEMLSRLFEEEVPQQELLEQLILPVPSSVEEQLHRHYENVLERNEELEMRMSALEQENKLLHEKNDLLRNNLTALYRTSLAEIRFRNLQIASLQKQLQSRVSDKSSSVSEQSMDRFHAAVDQGNMSGVSRTETILSVSGCCSKGTEKTDERRALAADAFSPELNLCASSRSSVSSRANTCSSFGPLLSSSNTITCSSTDVSLIASGTDIVAAHTLGVDNDLLSGAMIPVQPLISTCHLLKPENTKSQHLNTFSAVDCSLHLLSYSSSQDSVVQVVESEPSLMSSSPVITSDLIMSGLQKNSSSDIMPKADREGKSKAKERSLGDKCSVEIKLINREFWGCTTATSDTSKSNVKDSKQNTLTSKELQNNCAMNVKPQEISLRLAKHKSNQKTACTITEVLSEPVEFTVGSETRNDRITLSSTVMPSKTDTSKQRKVSLSNSVETFDQTKFHSNLDSEVQDSLISKTGVKKKLHCPVERIRPKEISSSSNRQTKDFFIEENEPVQSPSHCDLGKIDSTVEKAKLKVEHQILKSVSETVGGKCRETTKSETLPHNDLRLKLVTKSKADVLHLEGANDLCQSVNKGKAKSLEKELDTYSGRKGSHKGNSRAGKADTSDLSMVDSHQETSSRSKHHSHRRKSETGEVFASGQSSKVKTRNDFVRLESGIGNNDQRRSSRETDICKGSVGSSQKRKLSISDTELPAKKIKSDESIQERLVKLSIMNPSPSEQPGFEPEETSLPSHHKRRKSVSASSNDKNLLRKPDLISRLTPEIEQLKRYIDMAEGHDVAQVISLKEGDKHLSRLAEQKRVLDSEKVQEAAPVETALQSTSVASQKKPLNDRNVPSLTVFTLRSMAKLKKPSLSRTRKQVGPSVEKGSSKQDCGVLAVSGEVANNPMEDHNLATAALVQGHLNSLSLETSLPKLVYSSQNEKLTVVSENSEVCVVMEHEPQNHDLRFEMNAGETLGTPSILSKEATYEKPSSSVNIDTVAVQEVTAKTPSIQSMETSKPLPLEDVSQNNLLSQRQELMNETNINDVGRVFDSATLCEMNKKLKRNVKQLLDGLFMSSKNKTHLDTKQNAEVHAVYQVEQPKYKRSRKQSADVPAETLQSPNNSSQASMSFDKLTCSSTPVKEISYLYLGTKVGKGIDIKENSARNTCSGDEVLSDTNVDVPATEVNPQNSSFDFLFDVAITGATPAHVSDSTPDAYEDENINFDQDFFANFALVQLDNPTAEAIESGQGCSIHKKTENFANTGDLEQNVTANSSDRDAELNIAESRSAFEDGNEQMETNAMADNVFSSNPDFSFDKEINFEHQNMHESTSNQKPCIDNIVKNLEISHKVSNWPTADVELLPSSEIQDGEPSLQISPFKRFLHNSDKQSGNGFSAPGIPGSSFSQSQCEALLKETVILSPAKNKMSLHSDEMADPVTICNVACSESELLQVHAPEESFDFYLSDTNDRLFGSVSVSPSSFKSPELEDGADGMSKTTAIRAKELPLNILEEFEEGEISNSEKDFPVDFGVRKKYNKIEQKVHDEQSRPRLLTKKKSFNGWHSRGHQYGRGRSDKFSKEIPRSGAEQIHRNSARSQMREKCKVRSPRMSCSLEAIPNTQKGRLEKLEGEATKHHKEKKDRTHSQERDHSRYSQEHTKCSDRYEHRQRSRTCHSNEKRRHRVTK